MWGKEAGSTATSRANISLAGVAEAQAGIFSEPRGLGGREWGVNIY